MITNREFGELPVTADFNQDRLPWSETQHALAANYSSKMPPSVTMGPDVSDAPGAGLYGAPATTPGDPNAQPVRDAMANAEIIEGNAAVPATGAQSIKFLERHPSQRNLLLIRNSSASANVWIGFGSPASQNSILQLPPGTLVVFDVRVPQNDLWAIADIAGATVSWGVSTIN